MAVHRTVKTTSKPAKITAPKVVAAAKSMAPPKSPKRKAIATAPQLTPAVVDVPKAATRVIKDAEIRVIRKVDQVVADTERTALVYRGMERDGADRLQALVISYGYLLHGAEEIQWSMWDMAQQSIGSALNIPREFARCRSFTEVAEKQQDFVQSVFSNWVTASHTILATSRRVVDRAIRPLESQLLEAAS